MVLGDSLTTAIDRANFKKTHIAPQQLMMLVFFMMSLFVLLFLIITKQPFPTFTIVSFGLMALIVVVSFSANVFDYKSLKVDDLALREPLTDFEPIIAGLIAYMLFPAQREPGFLIAFLLGVIIVYWGTHRRKLRKVQKKGMTFMLLSVCLYALLPNIYSFALEYLSPAYVTFFRVAATFILVLIFFPKVIPKKRLAAKKLKYGMLSGFTSSVGAVAWLYAIGSLGVVLTSLLMLLGPFVRYSAGYFVLKEKVLLGELASSFLLFTTVISSLVV